MKPTCSPDDSLLGLLSPPLSERQLSRMLGDRIHLPLIGAHVPSSDDRSRREFLQVVLEKALEIAAEVEDILIEDKEQ